ncbi:hypothetical protein DPX16_13144 [Anabarilius grahami]|uniref:Uncharacterized protein n=1 Tax=Anabarilius grahami TaxID=495550 RepID=A0A3N0YMK9_ANAGA|nr:hypothetical protein DPX16_13144 [Anabarilius grahami]
MTFMKPKLSYDIQSSTVTWQKPPTPALSRCPFNLMDVINNGCPLLTPTPGHRKSQASRSGSLSPAESSSPPPHRTAPHHTTPSQQTGTAQHSIKSSLAMETQLQ